MRALVLLPLLATALAAQSRFDEAFFNGDRKALLVGTAEALRTLKPKDAKYLVECGRAYLAALDKAKAEEVFRLAEALEPKDGLVLRGMANAWLKNGYKSEALEAYERVRQRDPKNKDVLLLCAVDLAEVAQVREADAFMELLVSQDKDKWEAFLAYGKALLVSGQRKKAAPWFALAVAVKPKEEKVLAEIARAFADTQAVF